MKERILIGAAAIVTAAILAGAVASHLRLAKLERTVAETKAAAEASETRGDELEKQTYVYKEKIEHLETRLTVIQAKGRVQDADLKTLAADADAARRDLQRYRRGTNTNR